MRLPAIRLPALLASLALAGSLAAAPAREFPGIPPDYLREAETVPAFWISTIEGVERFLHEHVRKGKVEEIGRTAEGRPIHGVFYGRPREGKGTTTFSGALGLNDVRAYLGPDSAKKVFLAMGAVHGGEFEGIVGLVNLLAVLETGRDLRGREWPELAAQAERLDRIVVLPIVNVDGRARVPLRMGRHRGEDWRAHEYFNTGAWADGRLIGWPTCKEFIPLDFSRTQFPGGYPNGKGVNLQHDDFLGARQPETQTLLELAARERPDLILNLHTGAPPTNYYLRMHRPVPEPALAHVYDELYRTVHTALTQAGLQSTRDVELEANPKKGGGMVNNLDCALSFHCGALCVLVESPSHTFSGTNRAGKVANHTPDDLLDAQLVLQQSAMQFLAEKGGRARWAPGRLPTSQKARN